MADQTAGVLQQLPEDVGERTADIVRELLAEIVRSSVKHGDQGHLPDGTGPDTLPMATVTRFDGVDGLHPVWSAHDLAEQATADTKAHSQNEGGDGTISWWLILREEVLEAAAEEDPQALADELVQVAAVAIKWAEAVRRRG